MTRRMKAVIVLGVGFLNFATAQAAQFQKLGKAVSTVLGSPKATKRTVSAGGQTADVFTLKGANGSADRYAFVQKGLYPPNCTHTWVVGVDPKKNTILDIQVVEMSCPHAYPTKENSFLSQYKGKGPADVKTLSTSIMTVSKATGSADLTTKAVERSILGAISLKGK